MVKLSKEELREKYKEDMKRSMKFETDEDYELYEESINKLVDINDVECIYDLVEGYEDDTDDPDHMNYLDTAIQHLIGEFPENIYAETLTKSLVKLRGVADERVEYLLGMMITRDMMKNEYIRVVKEMSEEEKKYHISILKKIKRNSTDEEETQKVLDVLDKVKGVHRSKPKN